MASAKLFLLSILFGWLLAPAAVRAQGAGTPLPSVGLRPIERAPGSTILGSTYVYKGRKLGSPFSVEIPIYELNDAVAIRHFRRFRTWTTVGRLTGLASVAYVLFNRTPDRQTSRTIYVGSLVASIGFSLISNHQVDSAVRRYNTVLRDGRIGLSAQPTPLGGAAVGLGLTVPLVDLGN